MTSHSWFNYHNRKLFYLSRLLRQDFWTELYVILSFL